METPYFKVKKLKEGGKIPSKREEDAGYDIYGLFEEDFQILNPGDVTLIPTGISCEIPKNWVLYVAERGSTGSKGIARRCGVVDSGYRGELFIATNNTSNKIVVFGKDDGIDLANFLESKNILKEDITFYPQSKAVAQVMLLQVPHVEVEEVTELTDSERGEGALGSSGK